MANRHLGRSIALQSLFEWDFRTLPEKALAEIEARNIAEFAPGIEDNSFVHTLINGALKKRKEIDNIIGKAAPEWPIERISYLDRNVLRLGLYELLFADRKEVPAKVAINEAIELAKTYGGDASGRFVNGVLGSVYRELGEPGKADAPKRKKRPADVPYEKMPIQKLGGAVVYAKAEGDTYIALVHDIFGHWTLSKGKIGDTPDIASESVETGTVREIKEELGLDITIKEPIGFNEYIASDPEKGKIRKQVHYFLGESAFTPLTLGTSGGLDDAQWFKLKDIVNLNFYPDTLPIVTKAVNILLKK
ncbi:MAG: transcription antitermination factor NusB [Candidatus Taylorbacteria bacterium RIFCSPHIGHO2_02_FULL_47_18]|uniref:Transcription antitermination protein NusB n=1 Tax=Candidatus Taylorbacteria bacterium RIFCSPLOWO2_01_FULL_48_100 TaxID=1802322 RepID=A0A1G2NE25_9BACT|nr:MAG: transcription antitermination factor NusB [Candidatus Taylorbacteria bacterium RIFCSPHIGHO2_01_FULL_48_38]OHA27611.1 MAG: transcription antitermination factor NusB [Candidatus Taylorbacteria bacterium RIFCSPHIGHO2_02_FULL_47_18]OHA34303.1 MAG: transcription antitermination factor NusB [Candidatus Taylorbacteria bacterium RIFCSPLOWO2_01_FULL_48_100]OHA40457.1 MAG: transcription antitermination factor NusB [Candidatus Taylorbacteria bacterium RIFCSPLOWO2_02_FULL_48_16]OHA44903.1 MAG: tran